MKIRTRGKRERLRDVERVLPTNPGTKHKHQASNILDHRYHSMDPQKGITTPDAWSHALRPMIKYYHNTSDIMIQLIRV